MSGVVRPTTLIDVLATINQNSLPPVQADDTTAQGVFVEADEAMTLADSMTTTVATPAGWDGGLWGSTCWG